jgi:hypothetical protein
MLAAALIASALATPGTGRADDEDDDGGHGYSIGVWGDVPYSTTQQTVGVPNLLADMNRARLAFSVHVGDQAGKQQPV